MKLLIAIPTIDYIHYAFAQSLTALVLHLKNRGEEFAVAFQGNTLVYAARDTLGRTAIEGGFEQVLWLDADMIFPKTLVEDLRKSGKGFVTGIYHARRPPHHSCVFSSLSPARRVESYPDEVFRIAGCGFGCVLMDTEILRDVMNTTGDLFLPDARFGEDLAFCERAGKLGHELWCDPAVKPGHIGQMAVYPEAEEKWTEGCGYERIYDREVLR